MLNRNFHINASIASSSFGLVLPRHYWLHC